MPITYKGFSTVGQTKHFRLTDFELVKQDLTNYFNIRKGEKLMNPDFGTIIWDMIFEPLNEDTKAEIMADIKKIVGYDPRLAAQNVLVTEYDRGLQIEIDLIYVQTNQVSKLQLQFDQQSRTAYQFV
jgi:phage baseplate assembly protein W